VFIVIIIIIESGRQEPQTFPASAMAPVCFRTSHVRRFLDDISTSAAYYGKKEEEVVQQFGAN
jgi:hypothetical protein